MYKSINNLDVSVPTKKTLVTRNLKNISVEQREKIQKETEYNVFSFPAQFLLVDYLSDSGTTSMTDKQWAALMLGDESYGRNTGYYVLLDAIRDIFERGDNQKKIIDLILRGEKDEEKLMEHFLKNYEGGFVNGGVNQLKRPNAFILPQGRCAEHLLFSTITKILHDENPDNKYWIPSNGHFDTTEANIHTNRINPVNLFSPEIFSEFDVEKLNSENPFKGNMDIARLIKFIEEKGADSIPMIYLTITNNTAAGQPVSLKNIKEVKI